MKISEENLMKVLVEKVDENIKFFYDSNSEIGIYTEQIIPKEKIKQLTTCEFLTNIP